MAGPSRELSRNEKGCLGCLVGGIFAVFASVIVYAFVAGASDSTSGAQAASGAGSQVVAPPASSTAPSPAQMLADLDGDRQPVGDYQAVLDALGPKCTQDEVHIAGLGDAGYKDLTQNGVTDETRLSVLQHLSDSVPASMGRTDCTSILSAYLVLREQG